MKRSFVLASLAFALIAMVAVAPASAVDNVTPGQAYDLVVNGSSGAYVSYSSSVTYYLVDVRTAEEWRWVGHPGMNKTGQGAALEGKVVNVAYMIDWKKQFIVNPSFLTEIDGIFGSVKENVVLIMMCRSGNRSAAAAAMLEAAGYRVMNITTGFSGGTDANGYRTKNGWVNDGYPYNYNSAGAYAD